MLIRAPALLVIVVGLINLSRFSGDFKMSSAAGWSSIAPAGNTALTVGVPGEQASRFVIGTDGSLSWIDRDGGSPDATVLKRMLSNSTQWDPPPLAAGATAKAVVLLPGARAGDVVAAAHSGTAADGMQELAVSAVVGPGNGTVTVVVRNLSVAAVDLPAGLVRVVLTQML